MQDAASAFGPQLPPRQVCPATQSASDEQVSKQAIVVPSQEKGAHTVDAAGLQVPLPSHWYRPVTASPAQFPALQGEPEGYRSHLPAPSHMPSRPQVAASLLAQSLAVRGTLPAGTGRQVPSELSSEQVMQVPVHALSQQTPSTQNPLLHWVSQEQARPGSLFRVPSSVHILDASAASVFPPSLIGTSVMDASVLGLAGDLLQPTPAATRAAIMTIRQAP